jgi:sulfatase maturation enzyme AslB (radical SAM superfamily)
MRKSIQKDIPQPIINRIIELDEKLERAFFEKNELSYLDQVKVQNLENQIKKIYLKYSPAKLQNDIRQLQAEINLLLEKDELDIQRYSILDHKLKEELKEIKKPTMMTTLDDIRVKSFQERIDDIYGANEPNHKELQSVEELMKERDSLLSLI